ncbi:MAG: hypothetical protein Q4A77_07145 [Leptotrichia hongkongensis]|nr:hypothetical protein [Leptotrichia hongkongensis]
MFDNTEKLTKNKKYTQAELFKMVLENEDLREKTEELFALDFKELVSIKDEYPDYEFNLGGKSFAEDGGAGVYILLEDGSIGYVCFDFPLECGRIAENLVEWFELLLNCANFWLNYADRKYLENLEALEKKVKESEPKGQEQFEDAYGDDMPSYLELQKELSEKLDIKIYDSIAKDVLQKFFKTAERGPEFMTKYVPDNEIAEKLIKN